MPSTRVARKAQFHFPNGLISQGLSPSELKSLQKLALSRKFFLCPVDLTFFVNCFAKKHLPSPIGSQIYLPLSSTICLSSANIWHTRTQTKPGSLSWRQGRTWEGGYPPLPLYNTVFVKWNPSVLEAFLQNEDPNSNKNLSTFYLIG